jgi:hypothetical protein
MSTSNAAADASWLVSISRALLTGGGFPSNYNGPSSVAGRIRPVIVMAAAMLTAEAAKILQEGALAEMKEAEKT